MVKLIALLKRKPGISKEEFERRWLEDHIKLSAKIPDVRGYYINIATPHQPAGVGEEPTYDGSAEMWWDSIDAMEAAFDSDIGKAAGADADEFCSVRLHVYTDEHTIIPYLAHAPKPRAAAKRRPVAKRRAVKRTKRAR